MRQLRYGEIAMIKQPCHIIAPATVTAEKTTLTAAGLIKEYLMQDIRYNLDDKLWSKWVEEDFLEPLNCSISRWWVK